MFFYEGQRCPVCGQYFGEQDDIITCPDCGAPHHRNCWKEEGHCHFIDLHGTDRSWDEASNAEPETTKRCARCGYDNPEFSEFCAKCGYEFPSQDWENTSPFPAQDRPPVRQYTPPHTGVYTTFGQPPMQDPYGGVPRTETIDGIPVDTIAQLIGPNSAYYLPRFHRMANGGSKASWNWSAFFFSYNWLLYRKNFLFGGLSFVVLTLLSFLSESILNQFESKITGNTMDAMWQAAQAMAASEQGRLLGGILTIASFALVLLRVLIGLFGNYLYMRTILRKAKKLNGEPPSPYDDSFRRSGGVSFGLAVAPDLLMVLITYVLYFLISI